MKYCNHCGKELIDEAAFCPNCGCKVYNPSNERQPVPTDKPLKGKGLGFVFSFFFGLIGFILALCLGDEDCKKAAITTFIVCLCIVVALIIILVAAVAVTAATPTYYYYY